MLHEAYIESCYGHDLADGVIDIDDLIIAALLQGRRQQLSNTMLESN